MAPANDSRKFWTIPQLAAELGYSAGTVRRLINNRMIPASRIAEHGSFRIPAAVAQQLISRFKPE